MESHLLEILVCPLCKGPLQYDRPAQELICKADKLAFPVRDGIPVMLENEARALNAAGPGSGSAGQAASANAQASTSATNSSDTPAPTSPDSET